MRTLRPQNQPGVSVLSPLRHSPFRNSKSFGSTLLQGVFRRSPKVVTSLAKTVRREAGRNWPRYSNLKDLSVSYEGRSEIFPVRLPDISPAGMFINTAADFPEGAILKVSFRLVRSNRPIDVRCEVRY